MIIRYLSVSSRRLLRLQTQLQHVSQRLSQARLATFVVVLVSTITCAEFHQWFWMWLCVILGSVLFFYLVRWHRAIRQQQRRVQEALASKEAHRARLARDWSRIPALPLTRPIAGHPFEHDLDITGEESLYRLMHTCLTQEGSERLKDWLLSTTPDPERIQRRQKQVQILRPQIAWRDALRLSLVEAESQMQHLHPAGTPWESRRILTQLQIEAIPIQRELSLLIVLSLLLIITWIAQRFNFLPALVWQSCWALYLIGFGISRRKTGALFENSQKLLHDLARLEPLFDFLEHHANQDKHTLLSLFKGEHKPAQHIKKLGRIVAGSSIQGNQILWVMLNAVVPWDLYFAWRWEQLLPDLRQKMPQWLDSLWELEALCALAHFAWLHPEAPFPEMGMPVFKVLGLGHPLLPRTQLVRNDDVLGQIGEGFLITGSNMAGKSTYLKSLGLNLVLAQAGTVVDAKAFAAPYLRPFACIQVSDSVVDGLSYFYAEVQRLKALLDALHSDSPFALFFLVDEIFRGTNNRERLLGSQAYLEALAGKRGIGGVSTHDLELVQLADAHPHLRNLHFREDIIEGKMHFDYQLRPGPCPTTNALRIMALAGLPVPNERLNPL